MFATTYTYDADGERVRKTTGSDFTEYIYLGGQVISEMHANGDWSDYIFAAGRRIAKADSYEDRIHTSGNNCSSCGAQTSSFKSTILAGYTIQTGDKLYLRQWESTSARGGPMLWFTDFTSTAGLNDQNGILSVADTTTTMWHYRMIDLSSVAGKVIGNSGFFTDSSTGAGSWDIFYTDMAIVSTDGTVHPIYNRQTSISLTATGTAGTSTRTYAIDHQSNIGPNYDVSTNYYASDHLGSSTMMLNVNGYPVTQSTFLPYGYDYTAQMSMNNYKFTDLEHDAESGLDHTMHRQYASNQGRWLHPDPAGRRAVKITNPQTWNRYAYVGGNPINALDRSGLYPCEVGAIGSGCDPETGGGEGWFFSDFGGLSDPEFFYRPGKGCKVNGTYVTPCPTVGTNSSYCDASRASCNNGPNESGPNATDPNDKVPGHGGTGGTDVTDVNQAIRKQVAHDCYNEFINGTTMGKGIGVLSLGPVITPLNDESASQQLLTLAGGWSSFSIKAVIRNLPEKLAAVAEKAEGAFTLGTVVATGADVAVAVGCSVDTLFLPLGNGNPDPGTPGGNPNDESDPGNW